MERGIFSRLEAGALCGVSRQGTSPPEVLPRRRAALVRRWCRRRSDLSPGQSGLEGDVRGTQEQDQRGLVSQS